MDGKRLIRSIKLTNLLSFGPDGMEIELQPLNVLIGANGSGKSNFLEAFRLLQAAPRDLTQPIAQGGGVDDWLWKGDRGTPEAEVFAVALTDEEDVYNVVTSYTVAFTSSGQRFHLTKELVGLGVAGPDKVSIDPDRLYDFNDGKPLALTAAPDESDEPARLPLKSHGVRTTLKSNQSVLSQRADFVLPRAVSVLAEQLEGFYVFAESTFGKSFPARKPQSTDLDPTYLFEDGSNLALVLNELQHQPAVMRDLIEKLRLFYDRVEGVLPRVLGGTVQLYFQERGLHRTVPASRLSDGTLRFLCLLVLLCHPSPPPLMCIDEPELGMHPDIIPTVAKLLVEASQRTQLIVTTHSPLLISALQDVPESIVVCERTSKGTTLQRLDSAELKDWLEEFSLGDVWLKGALGGTRW